MAMILKLNQNGYVNNKKILNYTCYCFRVFPTTK